MEKKKKKVQVGIEWEWDFSQMKGTVREIKLEWNNSLVIKEPQKSHGKTVSGSMGEVLQRFESRELL